MIRVESESFLKESIHLTLILENPLGAYARTRIEAVITCEVERELKLAAYMEIVDAYVPAYAIPELRLGNEHEFVFFYCFGFREIRLREIHDILSPDIGKTAEAKPLDSEKVLHAPDKGELDRNIAGGSVVESLVEKFEIECIAEVRIVKEIIHAKEEILASETHASIIFDMGAERRENRILP